MVSGGSVSGTQSICSMVPGRSVPRYTDDPDHLDTDPLENAIEFKMSNLKI